MLTSSSDFLVVPDPKLLGLLRGTVVRYRDVLSQKPATQGKLVDVHLVTEGAGMMGLTDVADSLEWSGINNNTLRTARVATYIALLLQQAGVQIDPQLVLIATLLYKMGRRRWDQYCWYRSVAPTVEDPEHEDTGISLSLLEKAGVSSKILDIIRFRNIGLLLSTDTLSDALEPRLCMYADYRVAQQIVSIDERFADLFYRKRAPEANLVFLQSWAKKTQTEIFAHLSIRPEDINEDNPPIPYWEQLLRQAYLEDAQISAFQRLTYLHLLYGQQELSHVEFEFLLNKEFPLTSWWGISMRKEYNARFGIPVQAEMETTGLDRAILVFKALLQ